VLWNRHVIRIRHTTLKAWLRGWGVSTKPYVVDTKELRDRIQALFYDSNANDYETTRILVTKGFKISVRALRRIRKGISLLKRISANADVEYSQKISELLRIEYNKGTIEHYGKEFLTLYIRR